MRKKNLAVVVTAALVIGMALPAMASSVMKTIQIKTGITIFMNDVKVDAKDATGKSVEAFIYEGTTYLPVRAVADLMKVEVEWDGKTNSVYLGEHTKVVTPEPVKDTKAEWVGKYTEQYTYNYGTKDLSTSLYSADNIPYIDIKSDGTLKYKLNLFYTVYTFDGKWQIDKNNSNKINVTGMEGIKDAVSFVKVGQEITLQTKDYINFHSDSSTSTNKDRYKKK